MKKITLLAMSLILALTVKAQYGTDVTHLLTNPDFENGTIGWSIVGGGSTIATAADYEYSGTAFMEEWTPAPNTLSDNDWSQTIEVPNGVYAVKALAHAVLQSDLSVAPEGISIYANDDKVAVTTNHTNPPKEYSVSTQVTDGTLTIGLNIASCNINWVAWDNVRIIQYSAQTMEAAEVMRLKDEMNALAESAQEFINGKIQTALAESLMAAIERIESVKTLNEAQALWSSMNTMVAEAQASSEAYIALQAKIEEAHEWLSRGYAAGFYTFENAISNAEYYYNEAPLNVEETLEATKALNNAIFNYFNHNADGTIGFPMEEVYVTNPTVRTSNTGWTYNPEGTKAFVDQHIAEFYNTDYDMSQTIEDLPNGKYKVSVTGFYRATGNDSNIGFDAHENGTENITAMLYANDEAVPLACLYEHNIEEINAAAPSDVTIGGWNNFANSMYETSICFDKGFYATNEVEVIVTDGTLTMGIRNQNHQANSWTAFRDFRLTYYGGWDLEDGHLTIWEDYGYSSPEEYPWHALRDQITSVEIKEGVTIIGRYAFYMCTDLTSITIPETVTSIDYASFQDCINLPAVEIPESVTSIGGWAFKDCNSLTSINIPQGVTDINPWTFSYCTSLTSINIPQGVTYIGNYAFEKCSLTSITIPQSVTTISAEAFLGCTGEVTIESDLSSAQFRGNSFTKVTLGNNVTKILAHMFEESRLLSSVTMSENITSIGEYAFAGCSNLKSITIPASVTEIGNYAFSASGVKDIVSLATTAPTLGEETFGCISFEATLNYPEGSDYSSWTQYFEGDIYYLKNVATGTYLQAGLSWGTLPTLGEDGLDVRIVELPNGKYSIATNVSNGGNSYYFGIVKDGSINDGFIYLDTSISEWTIQQQANGYYTFTLDGSNYMGYNGSDEVSFTLTDASQPNAQWQLITKEERIAAMTGMSTPTDATFLLPGANFNRNDIRNTSWYGAPTVSGYGNDNGSNFCAEKWNVTAFDVYQEVAVPNGYYRITAQGFYRMDDPNEGPGTFDEQHAAGTETLNAILYANEVSTPLMSIIEGAQAEPFIYGNSFETTYGYVPNEMQSAAEAFAAGLYEHSLLVHVTDGILRIGVKKETGEMGDWAIFDNFNITYYGASFAANEVGALINGTFGDASAASLEGWTVGLGSMNTGNHNKWSNFNDGFAEQWVNGYSEENTLEDIEFYQEVKGLTAGNYIFAISAIACQQSTDDSYEVSGIKVYANNDSVAVHTINVDRDDTNRLIGAEEIYIPVTLAEGETLRVGVSVKNTDANWMAIDNAKLYCFDQATLIQAVINHANQLIKDNPIVKGITLSALKSEITAANNLETLRGAIATFNTAILSYNQLDALVKEYEGIAQLSAAIAAAKKVLTSATATIVEVDEAYIVLEEAVYQYRFSAASLTYPCDITSRYVVNPQMEEGTNGWTTNMLPDPNNQGYNNGNAYIHHFIERWVWDGDLGNIYATQAISSLPDGIYRLSADIIATRQLADDPKGAAKGAYLFINEDSVAVATEDIKPERFEVYADVKGGVIEIGITGTEITANWLAWDNVTLEFLGGYTSGDVNSDDKHTMNDVVMTVNAVLEKPSEKFHPYAADVNDDDVIAMGDVVNILQMVLTEGTHAASYARSRTAAYDSKLAFTTTEATVATGIDCVVPVALSNTGTYSAFQVDVELPAGVELIDIQLSDRAQGTHTVAWNTLSNGMTRVVAYAADNAAFAGNEGDLINFVVKADATLASDAAMTLVKGMFVTVTGAEHTIANASITLRAKTTEIENVGTSALSVYGITKAIVIETPEAAVVDIFAIDGKLVQSVSLTAGKSLISVPAGIYVVNNSKVTVK